MADLNKSTLDPELVKYLEGVMPSEPRTFNAFLSTGENSAIITFYPINVYGKNYMASGIALLDATRGDINTLLLSFQGSIIPLEFGLSSSDVKYNVIILMNGISSLYIDTTENNRTMMVQSNLPSTFINPTPRVIYVFAAFCV